MVGWQEHKLSDDIAIYGELASVLLFLWILLIIWCKSSLHYYLFLCFGVR